MKGIKNISNTEDRIPVKFSAINPFIAENLPKPEEKEISGKGYVTYGDDNHYSEFLLSLFENCSTLQSIINGTVNYIGGDKVYLFGIEDKAVNRKGDTIADLIAKISTDYLTFGNAYIQVIRSRNGDVAELNWIDANKVRTDKDNQSFYYSDDWAHSYGRVKTIVYPKFIPENREVISSVVMVKSPQSRGAYGSPMWSSAVKDVLIDTKIADFHLNEISNNFLGSVIVNLNNGIPSDDAKEEIEKMFNEKFAGSGNAGRVLLAFNESTKNTTTVTKLGTDDFDSRYNDLAKRVREQIFVAFRAIPALFGLMTESTGFNEQEFSESFKLYNRTCVQPIQKMLARTFERIYGQKDILSIDPFKIENNDNEKTVE